MKKLLALLLALTLALSLAACGSAGAPSAGSGSSSSGDAEPITLVVFAAAHAVPLTGIHFLYRDARLLCHAENGRYRTVFLPAPHKDAVDGSARFKRLRNGIAPCYDISFSLVFHEQTYSFPRL